MYVTINNIVHYYNNNTIVLYISDMSLKIAISHVTINTLYHTINTLYHTINRLSSDMLL